MNCGNEVEIAPWLTDALRILHEEEPGAFIVGSAFLSPFFAGKYGPRLAPASVDVLAPAASADLQQRLEVAAPAVRWRVGHSGEPLGELGRQPLVAACGGFILGDDGPEAVFANRLTQSHLRAGLLTPRFSFDAAASSASHLLRLYPGVQAPFLGYYGETTDDSMPRIREAVEAGERGGRWTPAQPSRSELAWVTAVREWHDQNQPASGWVPLPGRSDLPEADPWQAADGQFREWLLQQTLLRDSAPDDSFLAEALAAQHGGQKPTHQGLETYLHAIIATLQLETDDSLASRRALRVATLLHDVGKAHNVWTPGAHPYIGAKIWRQLRPHWLADDEAALVSFLIRCHDLLGRLDRSISQPGFRGGVSPAQARVELLRSGLPLHEALSLAGAIYRADIAAVATLRWLLPLTPLLEGLVLAEPAEAPVAMAAAHSA